MMRTIQLLMFFCMIAAAASAQSHFAPVPSTGLPYTVIVLDMTVNGAAAQPNSEVALFDDTVCVGAALFTGTYPVTVTAWKGNPSLDLRGFTAGRPMTVKTFAPVQGVWKEILMVPTYETGDGMFGTGAFSSLRITNRVTAIAAEEQKTGAYGIRQYPNPFNGSLRVTVNIPVTGTYQVTVTSVDGKVLFQELKYFVAGSPEHFGWDAASYGMRSSSCYIVTVRGGGRSYSIKSLYLK